MPIKEKRQERENVIVSFMNYIHLGRKKRKKKHSH